MAAKKPTAKSVPKPIRGSADRVVDGVTISMPDSPLTPAKQESEGITFLTSPEDYEKTSRSQIAYFNELADRIESGDPTLTVLDGIWAAGAIRAYASQIPLQAPKGRGRQPVVDPGRVALEFAVLTVLKAVPKSAARAQLAEEHGVSDEAIRKALKKHGPTAAKWLSNLKKK